MSDHRPCWTTEDELHFVRSLYARGLRELLRKYLDNARSRNWYGPGMSVEPGVVILEIEDLLSTMDGAARAMSAGKAQ